MAAEDICKDYASSLEDLTFNSKPLINMLTMLAEENSQYAAEIVKLIEKRIYEVSIDQKLPSLYLMDSIVKNIGDSYTSSVSPCIVALFTHVFEQADEKKRLSMFKLRNTWPSYFPPKILHELDCSVHKRDPGWPVVEPPPPSPSIHINPKFLSKVDKALEESAVSSSSSDEAKIMDEFERKNKELELLQGEQMRLQMMQLEELKMKYELIKKKQEKDRQNLLKQQQEKILKMRLQQEEVDLVEESSSKDSKSSAIAMTVKQDKRDPRIKKLEVDSQTTDTDTSTDNAEPEKTEEKPSSANSESTAMKTVEKVGFDLEFVPLGKEVDQMDTTPVVSYNRDRPLGKNRYFRKDPKAKIMKSDSDSGSDFGDAKVSGEARSISRGGRRGGAHHNEKYKKSDRDDKYEERRRSERGRPRRRNSGDRPRETAGDRHHPSDGEREMRRTGPEDRPDGPRRTERPDVPHRAEVRPRDRTSDRLEEHGHLGDERHGDRPATDLGKDNKRRRRRIDENEHEDTRSRQYHRAEWGRGRGLRRPRRGHAVELDGPIERRTRHEFPRPIDNTGRLNERREQDFDLIDKVSLFEEPPFKKSRTPYEAPRPLFSEKEIFEIRERRRDDNPPDEWRKERPGFHEQWRHDDHFPPRLGPRPQGFPSSGDRPPFEKRDMPGEFLPPHQHFPGDVEIPLELTLDNEAQIIRSADLRLRMGEISVEQHRELLEKLEQLYELQKWQRRRSIDLLHDSGHPSFPPAIHPHSEGFPLHGLQIIPEASLNDDHNQEGRMVGGPEMFSHQPHAAGLMTGDDGLHSSVDQVLPHEPSVLPDQTTPATEAEAPPSNLVMEKQTVDDLFTRLMDFGIITKVNQGASPARTMTPPVMELLKEISVPVQQELPELPEIKLTLDHLRRRYDGVILELHHGTQCSSCGLRFKEVDNEKYSQHLDWHFRMNRKEKETLVGHRSWFITSDDWLEFESSEDPNIKARSAVFEADSEGESEKSEDLQEGSCPVLVGDTEAEKACDICFEKFETFWEEASEDWHYKNAVRVEGKTYHYLCYQDAKEAAEESDIEASDENTQENDDNINIADDNNVISQIKEEVTIESKIADDKPSIVTEALKVEQVVQGSDPVDNTNKEEIKTEFS